MLHTVLEATGLDTRTCALLLGFNPQLFASWASGQSQIPESVLPLISAVFGVAPSYLLAPKAAKSIDPADVTSQIWYKFRGSGLVSADREYVVVIRQVGYFLNELEEVTKQKALQWKSLFAAIRDAVDVQAAPREQGKAAARIFRESTTLAHGATGSGEVLRGLLRSLGILVIETPVKESRVEGCSFYVGSAHASRPCVFANTHHASWFRRNAVLMHELGHSIFEPFTGAALDFADSHTVDDAIEIRAQAFAQETMIPREVLLTIAQRYGIKWNSLNARALAQLVADSHVELRLIVSAAVDAGYLLPAQTADVLRIDIGSHLKEFSRHALSTEEYLEVAGTTQANWIGKRTTTVPPLPLRLPIGYVNAVVDAWRNRHISRGKAAEFLLIDDRDLIERFGEPPDDTEM